MLLRGMDGLLGIIFCVSFSFYTCGVHVHDGVSYQGVVILLSLSYINIMKPRHKRVKIVPPNIPDNIIDI